MRDMLKKHNEYEEIGKHTRNPPPVTQRHRVHRYKRCYTEAQSTPLQKMLHRDTEYTVTKDATQRHRVHRYKRCYTETQSTPLQKMLHRDTEYTVTKDATQRHREDGTMWI